jgi:hypothetical protein
MGVGQASKVSTRCLEAGPIQRRVSRGQKHFFAGFSWFLSHDGGGSE